MSQGFVGSNLPSRGMGGGRYRSNRNRLALPNMSASRPDIATNNIGEYTSFLKLHTFSLQKEWGLILFLGGRGGCPGSHSGMWGSSGDPILGMGHVHPLFGRFTPPVTLRPQMPTFPPEACPKKHPQKKGMPAWLPYLAAGVLGKQSAPGRIPYLSGFGMHLVHPLISQHPTLIGAVGKRLAGKRLGKRLYCKILQTR